jgi:hypothetical protein
VTTAAREYISLDATGRDVEDFDRIRAIKRAILEVFGERVAYQILRLETPEHIEDELRDADQILAASDGRLPVFLVNITYTKEELDPADFEPIEKEFGLRLVGEYTDNLT